MSRAWVLTVAGDFSGRPDVSGPRAFPVDRDDFEDVLRAISPRLDLDLPFCREVSFTRFEDFRPDGLVERVPALRSLLAAREAVADPSRMRRRLEEAGVEGAFADAEPADHPESGTPPRPEVTPPDGAALLEEMLETEERRRPAPPRTPLDAIDARIREIVESSVDRTDYAAQDRRRERVDAEIATRVRVILRDARFRRLEANWLSLRSLVRKVRTGEHLRIRVVDSAADSEVSPEMIGLLRGDPEEPTCLLVADALLRADEDGVATARRLGVLGERLGVPVVAGWDASASPPEDLVDDPRWAELRAAPGAARLGLCAPRVLLRLPYGVETDPAEHFRFEEDAAAEFPTWGSAAFVLAAAAATAQDAEGSLAGLGRFLEIEGLPQHVVGRGATARAVGPVELEAPESRLERWKSAGLVPVTGVRGRDVARVLSLRSLRGAPLFGPD